MTITVHGGSRTDDGRTDLDDRAGIEHFTSDGERRGKVSEVKDASFKVDAPFKPDFWLPLNMVASVTADRVLVSFPKEQLDHYKSNEPLVA